MGILGPSGAGKSSIFKMVTMAMSRSSGKLELLGRDFDNPSSPQALTNGDIGIVYQEDVMWHELTVDDNLRTIGKLKGLDEDEIDARMITLKKMLFLDVHSSKLAKNLSGGNKRKLCCAMALLKTPRLIFMDEASNGVDPISRKNLYSYLKRLKETSTMLITHRIDEAEKICDKIAIMADGEFLDLDHPNQLKEKYGVVYILQVDPSVSTAISLERINSRITTALPFCKRIQSINEDSEGGFDEDGSATLRPKLTYRFDDVESINNRVTADIGTESRGSSFTDLRKQPDGKHPADRRMANQVSDIEVRRKIAFMFKFVAELMQEGTIIDFSIYRSSLEQVFKKMVLGSDSTPILDNSQLVIRNEIT